MGGGCHLWEIPEMAHLWHLRDFGCKEDNLPSQGFDFFDVLNAIYDFLSVQNIPFFPILLIFPLGAGLHVDSLGYNALKSR